MELTDKRRIALLLSGDIDQYESIYKTYFRPLYIYACTIVNDEAQAEEIVQNLFLKIWERKEKLAIETSLKAYLYKCIYHDSLNYLKHLKVRSNYEIHAVNVMKNTTSASAGNKLSYNNLEEKLRQALNELPEQCRTVFQMSRYEELRYREIAGRLGISEKTVENHMGKALKLLRLKLADFLLTLTLFFYYLKNSLP